MLDKFLTNDNEKIDFLIINKKNELLWEQNFENLKNQIFVYY